MEVAVESIIDVLGGKAAIGKVVKDKMDLIDLTRAGINKKSVLALGAALDVNTKEMAGMLHTTPRTLQRKKDDQTLDVYITEQAIEVAEIVAKGIEVFGDITKVRLWLNAENQALGNIKPIHIMDTTIGARMVMDELGRLEHFVFS